MCVSLFEASTDKDYIEPSRVFNGIQIGVSTWKGVSLEILLKINLWLKLVWVPPTLLCLHVRPVGTHFSLRAQV